MSSCQRATLTGLLLTAAFTLWASPRPRESADEILRSLPNASGVAVFVGCTDLSLPTQLAENSGLILHLLVRDAAGLHAARRLLESRGLAGRASAELWTSRTLPYPEHFVNLIVLEDPAAVPRAERLRVLAPGGVAWVRRDGAWSLEHKPWPEEISKWHVPARQV